MSQRHTQLAAWRQASCCRRSAQHRHQRGCPVRAHVEGLDESISDYDVLTQKVEVRLMFSLAFFASQLSHSSILTAKLAVIGK